MPNEINFVSQASILKELGIEDNPRQVRRVSNDSLVQDRALQLLIKEKIPQVLAEMSPQERERLAKRTGEPATLKVVVSWNVGKTVISGQLFISATGTRVVGKSSQTLGTTYFRGNPDKAAKAFKAFGESIPQHILKAYAANYQGPWMPLEDSRDGALYSACIAPGRAPDPTVLPGPGFEGTTGHPKKETHGPKFFTLGPEEIS